MKYMMLIYDNAGSRELFFSEEGKPLMAEMEALVGEIQASGELIGTNGLADPSRTLTVGPADGAGGAGGAVAVTDGPFVEAKEFLGGYLLLDVESEERAREIAVRWPSARFTPVELRPVMSGDGPEM
jgi:hypothetical protein